MGIAPQNYNEGANVDLSGFFREVYDCDQVTIWRFLIASRYPSPSLAGFPWRWWCTGGFVLQIQSGFFEIGSPYLISARDPEISILKRICHESWYAGGLGSPGRQASPHTVRSGSWLTFLWMDPWRNQSMPRIAQPSLNQISWFKNQSGFCQSIPCDDAITKNKEKEEKRSIQYLGGICEEDDSPWNKSKVRGVKRRRISEFLLIDMGNLNPKPQWRTWNDARI